MMVCYNVCVCVFVFRDVQIQKRSITAVIKPPTDLSACEQIDASVQNAACSRVGDCHVKSAVCVCVCVCVCVLFIYIFF